MGRAGGFTPKRLFFEGRPVPNALEANQVVSRFCVCVCVCVCVWVCVRRRHLCVQTARRRLQPTGGGVWAAGRVG